MEADTRGVTTRKEPKAEKSIGRTGKAEIEQLPPRTSRFWAAPSLSVWFRYWASHFTSASGNDRTFAKWFAQWIVFADQRNRSLRCVRSRGQHWLKPPAASTTLNDNVLYHSLKRIVKKAGEKTN